YQGPKARLRVQAFGLRSQLAHADWQPKRLNSEPGQRCGRREAAAWVCTAMYPAQKQMTTKRPVTRGLSTPLPRSAAHRFGLSRSNSCILILNLLLSSFSFEPGRLRRLVAALAAVIFLAVAPYAASRSATGRPPEPAAEQPPGDTFAEAPDAQVVAEEP